MFNNKETANQYLPLKFVIYHNGQIVSQFPLPSKKFFIGKTKGLSVFLDHPSVSASHACVAPKDKGGEIVDLMSEKGISINGQKVQRGYFNIGDRLLIGEVELMVELSGENKIPVTPHTSEVTASRDALPLLRLSDKKQQPTTEAYLATGSTSATPHGDAGEHRREEAVPHFTLIEGGYDDITFDDSSFTPLNIIPVLQQDFANPDYIDFVENEEETDDLIQQKTKQKQYKKTALEVTTSLNGNILSVDYLPLKNKTYSIGPTGQNEKTIGLACLHENKYLPFVKVTKGAVHVHRPPRFKVRYLTPEAKSNDSHIKGEIFELKSDDVLSLEWKTTQIFIRHSPPPPPLKTAPFFTGKEVDDRNTVVKVFGTLMSLMLLLLLVDTAKQELPQKKISVIYRVKPAEPSPNPKKQPVENTPQQIVDQQPKAPPNPDKEKPKMAASAPAQPKQLKRPPRQSPSRKKLKKQVARKAPAKKQKAPPIKSYSFAAKGQLRNFFKSAKSAKIGKLVKNTTNTNTTSLDMARNLSTGRASASLPSTRLGEGFQGDYDHSVGSKGLSAKKGINTAYQIPPPKVVLGSMDPELLRQILRGVYAPI